MASIRVGRRRVLGIALAAVVLASTGARSQPAAKPRHIGVLLLRATQVIQ